jgi:hypothetical protein
VKPLFRRNSTPWNNALKLTAHRCGQVGAGAPQLNAVLYGRLQVAR